MKRWRLRGAPGPVDAGRVQAVLAGVATPHLAANCLRALQDLLPMTFCTVFAAGRNGAIETMSAASSYGTAAERTAALYVERRYDRRDPHMLWLAARKLPAQPQLWLGHHSGDELQDADYRAACYEDVGIRERASLLRLSPAGERAAISFYRSHSLPAFGEADFAAMARYAPVLAEAIAAHGRARGSAQTMPGAGREARLLALSLREREVIGELLQGRTAKEVAQVLGVQPTTVRTLQYRAFRRLGIRTLRELLRGGAG